jgi:hypothetical protein
LLVAIAGAKPFADSDRRRHLIRLLRDDKSAQLPTHADLLSLIPGLGWRSGALQASSLRAMAGRHRTTITKRPGSTKAIIRKVAPCAIAYR